MPVARIYASLVEEAEPICADLLARGYNVEVVFPDAILTNPADLELRVERCSAEQAIARVEAGGSPSRCMFVTPAKGPRRELLLVEMTVLATGTDGRHPMAMPGVALVAEHLAVVPMVSEEVSNGASARAEVLPFPVVMPETAAPDVVVGEKTPEPDSSVVARMEQTRARRRESDQGMSKNLIAELNLFLAHAPVVERPEPLQAMLKTLRHSKSMERARKNWENLTLVGIAASLVILIAVGWYAVPDRSRREVAANLRPSVLAAAPAAHQPAESASSVEPVSVKQASVVPATLATQTPSFPLKLASERRLLVAPAHRRRLRIEEDLLARDHVVQTAQRSAMSSQPTSKLLSSQAPISMQPATTSQLIRPAAIRSAPIQIITDLK